MCEECNDLRRRFQETESITERQSLWRIYDKQRKKCEGNLGILAPKKKKAEVTVKNKKSKKKSKAPESTEKSEEDTGANDKLEIRKIVDEFEGRFLIEKTPIGTFKVADQGQDRVTNIVANNLKDLRTKLKAYIRNNAPIKKPEETDRDTKSKKRCKYHYRAGLCANSLFDKPFCPCPGDPDKCPVKSQTEI